MKLLKKIKSLFKRRKPIVSENDITAFGRIKDAKSIPTLDIDEIHNVDNGHPV